MPPAMSLAADSAPVVDTSNKVTSKDVVTEKNYWNNFYSQFGVSIPSTWVSSHISSGLGFSWSWGVCLFHCDN